jgi:hypothetical protein
MGIGLSDAGQPIAAAKTFGSVPTRLKCSLTSVLQDALAFTMASEPTMPNRPEPSYRRSPTHVAAVPAEIRWVVSRSTGSAESGVSRFPTRCGGSSAADPMVTFPPNFIW